MRLVYFYEPKDSFRRTTATIVRHGLVLVDLDLDTALGSELGDDDAACDLFERLRIGLSAQAVVERMQVRGSNDVLQVRGLRPKNKR